MWKARQRADQPDGEAEERRRTLAAELRYQDLANDGDGQHAQEDPVGEETSKNVQLCEKC